MNKGWIEKNWWIHALLAAVAYCWWSGRAGDNIGEFKRIPTSTVHRSAGSGDSVRQYEADLIRIELTGEALLRTADTDWDATHSTPAPGGCPFGCWDPPSGCCIKGNISYETNEKIYHVPGQMFYEDTIIPTEYGERWFCAEAETRANGWRKSQQ